jgi:hypothetical protein
VSDEMQKELLNRIDALAANLGVTAEHIWRVLIQQAQVEAVRCILIVVVAVLCGAVLYWRVKASIEDDWDSELMIASVMVFAIATAVLSVLALIALTELPTLLLNPEYWALRQVARFF